MKDYLKKFTINRATWGYYTMYDPLTENMCAIGQYCTAAGVPKEAMINRAYPDESWCAEYPLPDLLCNPEQAIPTSSRWRYQVTSANDLESPERRENMLITLFAQEGIELTFEGSHRETIYSKRPH